jgi:hypothetical protein
VSPKRFGRTASSASSTGSNSRPHSPTDRGSPARERERRSGGGGAKISSSYDFLPEQGSAMGVQQTVSELEKARRQKMMMQAQSDRNVAYGRQGPQSPQSRAVAKMAAQGSFDSGELGRRDRQRDGRSSSPLSIDRGPPRDMNRVPSMEKSKLASPIVDEGWADTRAMQRPPSQEMLTGAAGAAGDGLRRKPPGNAGGSNSNERLSEEDEEKKKMLHKQMLELKKQLEEQLHRLQVC